jgi:hypothetical protein
MTFLTLENSGSQTVLHRPLDNTRNVPEVCMYIQSFVWKYNIKNYFGKSFNEMKELPPGLLF